MLLMLTCIAIILFESGIKIARAFINELGDAKLNFNLNYQAFTNLIHSNQLDINQQGIGAYLERLNAIDALKQLLGTQRIVTMLNIPFMFLYLAIIAYINVKIASLVLVIQTSLMLYMYVQSIIFRTSLTRQAEQQTIKNNFLLETISSIHTIKSLGSEALHARKFEYLTNNNIHEDYKVYQQNNAMARTVNIITKINLLAIFGCGAILVMNNELSLGALTGCALLSIHALQPLSQIMALCQKTLALRIAKQQQIQVTNPKDHEQGHNLPQMPQMPQHLHGKISLRNLSFQYSPHDPWLIHEINLDILSGEFIAIHNGTGKTTLLAILAGLLLPTTGKLIIDDKYNIAQYNNLSYRQQIAFIAANGKLFDGTILDNLIGFNHATPETVHRVINELGIANTVAMLPDGLQTYIGNAVETNVSRGFKQQLLIARALITNPKIIILDDATTSLDLQAIQALVTYLQKLKGTVTVIMTTNCQQLLALADQQFNIENSKLVIHHPLQEYEAYEHL